MSVPDPSQSEMQNPSSRNNGFNLRSLFQNRIFARVLGGLLGICLILYALGWYWSREPNPFDVVEEAAEAANVENPKELPLISDLDERRRVGIAPGVYLHDDAHRDR